MNISRYQRTLQEGSAAAKQMGICSAVKEKNAPSNASIAVRTSA